MEVRKIIKVSAEEIVRDYICDVLDLTIHQYRELKIDSSNITWKIKEEGDHDKGTYKQYLEYLEIKI